MVRSRLLLGILLLAALVPAYAEPEPAAAVEDVFAPLAPPSVDDEERSRLDAGEVLVRSLPTTDGEGLGVEAIGVVEAPPERVWSVMADCEDQDEYMPRVSFAEVRDREGDHHVCEVVIDLPFPVADSRSANLNQTRRLPDGGYQRHWTQAPGDWSYERNHGSWTAHPYGSGDTLLVNRMDLLPKSIIPVWVLRAAQTQQAPASFDAIRERVRSHGVASGG